MENSNIILAPDIPCFFQSQGHTCRYVFGNNLSSISVRDLTQVLPGLKAIPIEYDPNSLLLSIIPLGNGRQSQLPGKTPTSKPSNALGPSTRSAVMWRDGMSSRVISRDAHPSPFELLKCHSIAVVFDDNGAARLCDILESNRHLGSICVISVLDEFRQGNRPARNKSLAKLEQETCIYLKPQIIAVRPFIFGSLCYIFGINHS